MTGQSEQLQYWAALRDQLAHGVVTRPSVWEQMTLGLHLEERNNLFTLAKPSKRGSSVVETAAFTGKRPNFKKRPYQDEKTATVPRSWLVFLFEHEQLPQHLGWKRAETSFEEEDLVVHMDTMRNLTSGTPAATGNVRERAAHFDW